jgi:hypothetical protein
VPGAFFVSENGLQAPVKKNKPDRFVILEGKEGEMGSPEYGRGSAGRRRHVSRADDEDAEALKRRRKSSSVDRSRPIPTRHTSCSFTEPFQQFMKVKPSKGGPSARWPSWRHGAPETGPQSTNVATDRDESNLAAATRFDTPTLNIGGQAPSSALQGSVKYFNPLQQDILVSRNTDIRGGLHQESVSQACPLQVRKWTAFDIPIRSTLSAPKDRRAGRSTIWSQTRRSVSWPHSHMLLFD